ncbi:hypothetical protein ATANTOWER_019495 [Ataeniobius toweri]|uniref:Uncharacterized protein n=1 Tax=Ataeniobius toweri TaxID=208326 RepID=A0ABU7BB76_9TELE|nr:hypothetical protein [Ataeniobius toweri]
MRNGRIEEILEVLLPPPNNVPSRGQQLPTHTLNSVGEALLPPPEMPDGLPESLRGQSVVLFHGLTELLPGPSFCLCHSPGLSMLGLTVPVSRLRSHTSQPQPIGLLLQLDNIPYCRCLPLGIPRASLSIRRSCRRGLHLRLLPNPLCTGPSWFSLQVVGPLGDGLASLG